MYVYLLTVPLTWYYDAEFLSFGDSAIEASNEVANPRMLKMMGLRKPTKLSRQDPQIISSGRHKIKVIDILVQYTPV